MTDDPQPGRAEEPEAWWVLEPIPGYVRVTLPKESLVMPVDQIRRFARQLVMAADAAWTEVCSHCGGAHNALDHLGRP